MPTDRSETGAAHARANRAACMRLIFDPAPVTNCSPLSRWPILIAVLGLCFLAPSHAATDEGYFRDKTISYVVGQAAGGGYDRFARLLAP